jgi:hypothetical protein
VAVKRQAGKRRSTEHTPPAVFFAFEKHYSVTLRAAQWKEVEFGVHSAVLID